MDKYLDFLRCMARAMTVRTTAAEIGVQPATAFYWRHKTLAAGRGASEVRERIVALLIARVVAPQSKLATTRCWQNTSLALAPAVAEATADNLYEAMDSLAERQPDEERALARRHLHEGGLVLYDLSSSYVEGMHCPLAARGYNRDGKTGKAQINYSLVLDAEGRPVSVQVYPGNTADPKTVADQAHKLKETYHLAHVVLVGDRGMLTSARIDDLRATGGIDVQWHLGQVWAPYLFEDEYPGQHEDDCVVRPALRSAAALAKAFTKITPDGEEVQSFSTLLASLSSVVHNEVVVPAHPELAPFAMITTPNPLQSKLFRLVGLEVGRQKNTG